MEARAIEMSTGTARHIPTDLRPEGISMSTEIEYRIGSLMAEAENRRLFAGVSRDGLRRRLGRALIAFGRGIKGRAVVETTERRPCPPAARARA
jgi:hypothetical protein